MKLFESRKAKKLKENEGVATPENTSGRGEFAFGNNPANPADQSRGSGELAVNERLKENMMDQLPNSNLYLKGASRDINGNSTILLYYPNDKAFSIQTNQPQFFEVEKILRNYPNVDKIPEREKEIIERAVVGYIKRYGSAKQKSKLKVYDRLKEAEAFAGDFGDVMINPENKKAVETATKIFEKDYSKFGNQDPIFKMRFYGFKDALKVREFVDAIEKAGVKGTDVKIAKRFL